MILFDDTMAVRVRSAANLREHPMARHRRTASQREVARLFTWTRLQSVRLRHTPGPWCEALIVTFTRTGPKALDTDNLASACKALRDGVAEALGYDDADPHVEWRYAQAKGAYSLRIVITTRETRARAGEGDAEGGRPEVSRRDAQRKTVVETERVSSPIAAQLSSLPPALLIVEALSVFAPPASTVGGLT